MTLDAVATGLRPLPTLTVCTFTSDPPDQVARALAAVREIATEIVVAVDQRMDWSAAEMEPLEGVADRVLRRAFEFPLETNLAWLHDQCTSDWILRLDGDELSSRKLVDRLGSPGWDDDVTHVYIPRRWVWPDHGTVLDDAPWWPDPQLRLVRNGHVRFSREVHRPAHVAGYCRWIDAPVYHLDLLLNDEAERLAKAMRYESLSPGIRTDSGVSQNTGFYVPERSAIVPSTSSVPDVDRARIALMMGRVQGAPSGPTERATARTAADRVIAAEVVHAGPSRWIAGGAATIFARVINPTEDVLVPGQDPPVRLGARLRDTKGRQWAGELRAELPCPILPGAAELVPLRVAPTPPSGNYTLEVGLVREGIAWYEPLDVADVTTVRQRTVVVSAGISPHRHLGDDLIVRAGLQGLAAEMPEFEPILAGPDPSDSTARFGVRSVRDPASIVHRSGRAGLGRALLRILRLKMDARRMARGKSARDPAHAEYLGVMSATDALLLFGAGWLNSRYRDAQLLPKLAEVEVARTMGLPVLFEAGTVGPFTNRVDRVIARRILGHAFSVSVRDGGLSRKWARSVDVRGDRIWDVPDVATWSGVDTQPATERWLFANGISPTMGWAVVSARDSRDASASNDDLTDLTEGISSAVHLLARSGIPTVFLPHCVANEVDDRVVGGLIASSSPLVISTEMPSDDVALGLIRGATVAFGNRFHLALVADSAGVPGVFLATSAFDAQRSAAFNGGNIETLVDATAMPDAVKRALGRGSGQSGPSWSATAMADRLRSSVGVRAE